MYGRLLSLSVVLATFTPVDNCNCISSIPYRPHGMAICSYRTHHPREAARTRRVSRGCHVCSSAESESGLARLWLQSLCGHQAMPWAGISKDFVGAAGVTSELAPMAASSSGPQYGTAMTDSSVPMNQETVPRVRGHAPKMGAVVSPRTNPVLKLAHHYYRPPPSLNTEPRPSLWEGTT